MVNKVFLMCLVQFWVIYGVLYDARGGFYGVKMTKSRFFWDIEILIRGC